MQNSFGSNDSYQFHIENGSDKEAGIAMINNEHKYRNILILLDVIGLAFSFSLATYLRFGNFNYITDDVFVGLVAVIVLFVFFIFDLYNLELQVSGLRTPPRTLLAVFFAGLAVIVFNYLVGPDSADAKLLGRGVFALAMVTFSIWSAFWRYQLTMKVRKLRSARSYLFVCKKSEKNLFAQEFQSKEMGSLTSVSLTDSSDSISKIESLVKNKWDAIIIEEGVNLPGELLKLIMKRRLEGQRVLDIADFYESYWFKVPIFFLEDRWFAFSHGFQLIHNPIGLRIKRVLDVVFSLVAFILLLPLLIICWLSVFLSSKGPGVFKQIRVGESGRLFTIYKFRTMKVDAEAKGAQWAESGDPRITPIGRFLRKSRLDELPQLINVLKGDMSFIGPRPEVPKFHEDLEKEIPYYNLRNLMKPGITGWAQVMYKYGASVSDAIEKLQYELYYLKNYSIALDIAIIFKTIRVVLLGAGR